jgi:hypothetical protein
MQVKAVSYACDDEGLVLWVSNGCATDHRLVLPRASPIGINIANVACLLQHVKHNMIY